MRGNTIQIELPLKRGKVSKTIPLYQYDYGQNLVITGAELPQAYEVHFANEMHGDAVTSIGGSTGVAIPDSVLTSGDPIYLWLYLHEDSTDGETEFQGVIPVIKRASISDQTPTPAEQSAITEAIAALNTAVTQTTAAKNAAVAAQTHIENMTVSATTATPEAGASVTKSVNAQGEVNLAFAIPRGDKGDKGDQGIQGEAGTNGVNGTNGVSPVVSMSKEDGVTTLSITDATHTDTVEINDGEAGDPSELIDDDAGSGDTDVTWSANKLANLNETVSGKADLVSSPTEGNFAALTSGGNLTDSGHKHSDYICYDDDGHISGADLPNYEKSIIDSVFAVSGVTNVKVKANFTENEADGVPANKICVIVSNGDADSIASAIAGSNTSGLDTYGSVSRTVSGKTIYFSRPTSKSISIGITMTSIDSTFALSDVQTSINTAVRTMINQLDIGEKINTQKIRNTIYGAAGQNASKFLISDVAIVCSNTTYHDEFAIAWNEKCLVSSTSDITTTLVETIAGKADKVSSATNGNFAGLDSNGNLTDSGHKHSDYLTAHQDISGKSDLTNLAAAFSTSATYAVGDHVTYNGKYYVCSTAVSTAGSWDSSKWTETKIGGEFAAVKSEISDVKEELHDVLVYAESGETATLTNTENTSSFKNGEKGSFKKPTASQDGTLTYLCSNTGEKNPYTYHTKSAGTKKWVVGFKYKLTKLDPDLADPSYVRIHLGTTPYDNTLTWGEWVYFYKVATIDLTRIRFSLQGFSTAPTTDQFQLEIKEMYAYDATGVSDDLCNTIVSSQNTNYQDGTVTYGETAEGYMPDTSLAEEGKTADSKAVGDAIASVRMNVKKFGVKGDGTTDDTDAINSLFENYTGSFYFPAGTYKITGTLSLPSESEMFGDGDQTIIELGSTYDLDELTFRGNEKVYPYIVVNNNDNTKLHDFKLVGTNATEHTRHAGVAVLDSQNCVISDLTIYNINYDATQADVSPIISGYGICVTRSEYVAVERCYVEQCGYECIGIVDNCNHCTVRDCYTKNGWRTCIQVHRGSCNTLIENCYMLQAHDTYDACFTVHGLTDYKVVNLTVNNCVMECSQNGAQASTYCAPAQIMGDTVKLCFTNNKILGGKRAFYISEAHTNAKIIGNDMQCNDTSDYGVYIKSYETVVIGNVLQNDASTPVNYITNNPVISGNIGIS